MNLNLLDQYKDKPLFKIAMVIFIAFCIIKIATLGFEFGHWLQVN